MVFLEILNVPLRIIIAETVTYTGEHTVNWERFIGLNFPFFTVFKSTAKVFP